MLKLLETNYKNSAANASVEWISAQVLYRYLLKGDSLKKIERDLFGHEDLHGFFSKSILNFYHIDTSEISKNRGIFKNLSLLEIISLLLNSKSPYYMAIARTLKLLVP